jgi:hypothetical protein
MDKIKNALTKNKNTLKNTKIPPTFIALNKYKNPPKKYKNGPTVFPLKNTKRPQTYKEDPKNDNKAFIFIFKVLLKCLGFFCFF